MAEPAAARVIEESEPIAKLIAGGDFREATAQCARAHGPALGRLCMAMLGSQSEAEETAQEALLAAHDGMGSYRGDGSVRAWLFGIARRLCARRLETRGRQARRLRLVHDADPAAAAPDELVESRRRAEDVREALDRLKPSEREALLLRYESGLSYREIGVACGIDEAAARKRASRGLEQMRQIMKSEVNR